MMEVRFFRKDERAVLLNAINDLWSKNHVYVRKPEVLEHLVLNTPYRSEFAGEDNYSFVGIWNEQNKVVGILGSIPQELNFFGKRKRSSTFSIWYVDKKNAKNVNGLDLYEFIDEKEPSMKVAIGLSPEAYKIYGALGWYTIDDFPRWIGVNKVKETLSNLLPDDSTELYLPQTKPVAKRKTFKVLYDQIDKEKWNHFYDTQFAKRFVGTNRDYTFLEWRYLQSPILQYHTIILTDSNDEYKGLAVIRIESIISGKFKIGRILEFIAVEAEASVELANALINYDKDVLMWDFYCLSSITAFGLEAVGFRRIPDWMDKTMMPTRFQPVDYGHLKLNAAIWLEDKLKSKLQAINSNQWYITKGDADQDRAN